MLFRKNKGVRMKWMDIVLSNTIPEKSLQWRNDYSIWKWCRQYTLIDQLSHEKWLQKISNDPSIKMFGIRVQTEKESLFKEVGVCGLTSINLINRNAEFSLYVAPEYQGQGIGKHALCCLLSHGFDFFGLQRIWGESYQGNPAMKMFLSLGMKEEGVLRNSYFREGHYIDSHIVSILRDEYIAKKMLW